MEFNNKKGISLIILVITIIVIIILAGIIIVYLSSNNPISTASKAVFLGDIRNFQAELELSKNDQFLDNFSSYNPQLLQADDVSVTYNGVTDISKTIYDLIPSLDNITKYSGQFQIIDGQLVFVGYDTTKQDWAQGIGIEVVIIGEPKVTLIPSTELVVTPGTDIIYTVKFSSNVALTTIDLTGKLEILDNTGLALSVQPVTTIGAISGINSDVTREVDIYIKTDTLINGTYKLKIKSGVVTDVNNISNSLDTISAIGFDILDTISPINPVILANPTGWTNGNVTLTITYSSDSVTKQYSTNGTTWNTYTVPVVVTINNTTVYAKGKDLTSNESGVSTLTVANIDKTVPVVTVTNGGSTTSSVTVNAVASDTGGSGLVTGSYQYSKDNGTTWTAVTSATSYTFSSITSGTYQCKVKVADNATNTTTSNAVAISTTGLGTITLGASPTGWTNGNVSVTITYPAEVVTKQYSIDGTTWNTYTAAVVVSTNSTTVYAKGLDAGGNQTTQATLTVGNIDRTIPYVTSCTYSTTVQTTGIVTATIYISDTQSGPQQVTQSYNFTTNGNYTFTFYDVAGNSSTYVASVSNIYLSKTGTSASSSTTNSFVASVAYNDGTYTGTINKNGAPVVTHKYQYIDSPGGSFFWYASDYGAAALSLATPHVASDYIGGAAGPNPADWPAEYTIIQYYWSQGITYNASLGQNVRLCYIQYNHYRPLYTQNYSGTVYAPT